MYINICHIIPSGRWTGSGSWRSTLSPPPLRGVGGGVGVGVDLQLPLPLPIPTQSITFIN